MIPHKPKARIKLRADTYDELPYNPFRHSDAATFMGHYESHAWSESAISASGWLD